MNNLDFSNKRIAILAPTSASKITGGAERFYQGLQSALSKLVSHVELITIPSDESTYDHILHSYEVWKNLDLSCYDMVISTKNPTYVVTHPRHVLYLVHTPRVFYDMFKMAFPNASSERHKQRSVIQSLDTEAIKQIRRRFTIGHEVSSRLKTYNNLSSEVIHPPLGVDAFHQGDSAGYFFMPGRLHSWKRVDLAIRAVLSTTLPLKLIIAGSGESESELVSLASNDSRITFLGQVSDDELIDLYSRALAVIFTPIREDYGYVTLEAFKSGKPVITCADSGEPTHFVIHGKSGYVCEPNSDSISNAMVQMYNNKEKAMEMGLHGLSSVNHISWPNVAQTLLKSGFDDNFSGINHLNEDPLIKVAILDMQPIDPPIGGGRLRLMGLYHALGDKFRARYIGSYDWPGESYRRHYLSKSLEEINVPLSREHHIAAKQLSYNAGGKTVIDLAFARLCDLSPEYLAEAANAVRWADVVVFSHPWVYPHMEHYLNPKQLIVYDSQNVEGFLRAQLLDKNNPVESELLRDVVQAEHSVGRRAQLVLTCSQEDSALFSRIYDWPVQKLNIVPNGVMTKNISVPTDSEKIEAKKAIGFLKNSSVAIFIGSNYTPNVEAAEFIIDEISPVLPEVQFIIAGGVCEQIKGKESSNLTVTGRVDEEMKKIYLHASDIAINPMFSGSGTNIKMFEFMASGLPIISTLTGARGIATKSTEALRIASRQNFTTEIHNIISKSETIKLGMLNRLWVEKDYSWEKISSQLGDKLLEYYNANNKHVSQLRSSVYKNRNGNKLRIAHISTTGHKCGIGEYTLRLIDHLPKETTTNILVTCRASSSGSVSLQPDFKYTTLEGWYYDDEAWSGSFIYPKLVEHLVDWNADGALVQFHTSFFSSTTLKELVDSLLDEDINTSILIHKLNMSDLPIFAYLHSAGAKLLSHSHREVDAGGDYGINIMYLPIGVDQHLNNSIKSIANRDWYATPPVITTTGFMRKHKGIPNLIYAVKLLQRDFPGIKLVALCSIYPSEDSQVALNMCMEAIRECGLESLVTIETQFLSIETVYERISHADIAVLPYEESNEGGSASASTCFTAGLPVIVSDAEIFDDIRDVTIMLESTTPEEISKCLTEILKCSDKYSELIQKTHAYTKSASWENVAKKITGLF